MSKPTPTSIPPSERQWSGGELAGAILVRALMNCPNLDLQLYEAGAEFGEEDTAIEIGVAGEEALQTIGSELLSVLENAGASSLKSTRMVISNTSTDYPALSAGREYRALVPIEEARKLLGAIGLTENRQYTWMGKGWLVRLGTFDRDRTAFCIASHIDEKPGVSHDLRQTNDRTFLEKAFKGWGNQVVKNTIISAPAKK
ncbi:hypothetical protein M7I_3734 [Glarea lozoyensis 74030]|uniref:Uncharacterized protein n=1 Tax=Glarea lozoyensis (strain ATCC 74030 / MF5533) TaxID=1104152 RepID=H0EMA4_GLAL7|nr:hypothetical protein M7I_3734 [Glarea lozoyensis 74030]